MATGFDLSHVCFAGRPAAATGQIARPAGCKSPAPSPTPLRADEPAHGFVGWVLDRSGLDASVYRHRPLLRRLPSCLRTLQVRSVAEGRALLENRPDLLPAAVGSLLIGVTEFFRDPAVFEAVRARVVPELAACRRGPLRICSAGCSSGEELYSLAILLAEAGVLAGSFLLGTDCRIEAVRQASAGVYNAAPSEPAVCANLLRAGGRVLAGQRGAAAASTLGGCRLGRRDGPRPLGRHPLAEPGDLFESRPRRGPLEAADRGLVPRAS